jgi:sensor c-di-GMP phosphodiesterase-like protein
LVTVPEKMPDNRRFLLGLAHLRCVSVSSSAYPVPSCSEAPVAQNRKATSQAIPENADSASIIIATITMAHSLKLKVTAEGVETTEQLKFLRAHHYDGIQGYLLSKPLSADAMADMLTNHQRDGKPLPTG